MTFPVYIEIGPWSLHPHFLFEALAYFIGFRVYLYTRNQERLPMNKALWVMVGAVIGAALGSKILYWLESPETTLKHLTDPYYLMAGKTIVGGLLGGLIGVEWTKKIIGWKRSTGDDFVFPLLIGMAIGRIGCFLTGLSDQTYGTATSWIIGIDFGDGVMRHPTQLYEIIFLMGLGLLFFGMKKSSFLSNRNFPEGTLFQLFMISYLCFRLFIDFIKPTPHPYWGLNNIQVASILGLIYYLKFVKGWIKQSWKRRGLHA